MRCARVGLLASIVGVLAVAVAGSASAYPLIISTGGTVSYNNGSGTSGTITYLGHTYGTPAGTVSTIGTIGVTDIVLMFTATPTTGILDSIGVGAVFCDPGPFNGSPGTECTTSFAGRTTTGAGWGPDGSPDTSFVDIVSFSGTAGTRIFNFQDGPDSGTVGDLDPGEVSDRFFVSYSASDIIFDGRINVQFMISPLVGADFTQGITLIPEPSTVLLLGTGLAGIAFAGRRRR